MVDGLGNIFAKRLLLTVFIAIMGIVKTNHANIQFSKNLKEKIISSRPVCLSLTKIIEISLAAQDDEEFSYFLSSILDKTIQFDQNDTRIDLAHKWLENSANHIFNDPYRAPAEWIANAIDATVAKKGTGNPVGKFGLGFFSGLCFLLHQEQFWPNTDTLASLSIITSAKDGDVYHVIMTRTADKKDLTVTFLALSRKQKAVFFNQLHNLDVQSPKTGTIITLLPPAGQTLSDTMIYGIQDYFHYFDVYPHVTTIVNVQDNNQNRTRAYIGGYNKASSISVSLTPQEFSVMDTGTGISLETMISCLFVPSSSTKRIPEQVNNVQHTTDTTDIALPKYIDFLGKKDNTQSHFLITVNGIVVIDKPLDTPIFDENNTLKDIIMSMPQKTRLTVARDEVYIAPHAVSFEETYLKSVINKTIDHCFTTTTQQSLLLALYKGLSCWENKSSAHHIKGLFTSYFRQQLEHVINQQENLVPVPQELYASAILKDIEHGSTRIFPLDPELICYTYQKAEAFLTKTLKNSNAIALKGVAGTLISGKKVFFVSIPHITSLGLRNCLFVPEHFLTGKNEQEVVNAISACVTEQDLLPPTHNQFTASTLLVTNKNHSWCNIPTEFYHMQVLYKKIKDKHEPFSFKHTKILKDVFVKNMELFSNVYMWLFAFHEHSFNLSRFLADSSINSEPYKKTIMDLDILTQGIIDNASSFSVTKWSETISRFEGFFFDPETITFYRYNGNTQALKITGARIQNLLEKSEVIVRDIKEEILRPYSFEEVSIVDVANTFATALGLLIGFVTYDGISFSYDTNNVYFSGDLQLWPCEKKQMNIEAMFITFTCMALEYYLKRSKQQGVPFFLDNIQHTAIVHFLSQLRQGTSSMILSFPGYNQEELKTLIDLCETDYAWAKSLQPYLARSFQAINIPGYLEEIIGWLLYVVGPHSTINKKMQQKVIDVKSSLLGLYQRFFTIDFSLFPHTYGQEIIFKTIQSERDVTNINQTVYDVLEMLSHNESALNKLFTFVVADFSLKTESEKQRQDLAAQCLYVPTVMANTPLSLLAVLKERLKNDTLAYKIIQVIIEKSRSVQELAFISYIFLDEQILNVLRTIEPARHDELANICAYLFTHYIQEKIDPQRLDELYEKNRKTVSLAHRIANINDEVVGTLVKQYIQERATQTETPWGNTTTAYNNDIIQKTAPKSTVLLSQLLKAHCAGTGIYELLRQEKLQQALTKIKTFSAQTNLGKINQCIEAGSEKSALTATLVECLQNAIDAANDVYKKTGSADMINTIIFTLETMKKPETNSCSLCLSIKDYVGFDKFVTLLTDFLLPDFSNKAPQNGTIGTMGNGSFKMYQQAQTVSILTRIRQSKHCFHLLITPLRYTHNKQVYDLQISCKDVTSAVDGEFVGTDIKVTFLEEPDDVIRMNMLSIRDFLTTTIGATHACLTGSSIPFIMYERDGKGGLHRINQTTQASDIIYEWKENGETLFKILKRPSLYLQSYITTAGLPFAPFSTVNSEKKLLVMPMSNDMRMGYIIDLALSTYKPVQSRTTIQMVPDMVKKLRIALYEAYYIIGLKKAIQELKNNNNTYAVNLFEHLASCVHDFYQVSLSSADNTRACLLFESLLDGKNSTIALPQKLFFTYYKPYSLHGAQQQSFFDYIQDGYATLVSRLKNERSIIGSAAQARYQEWLSTYKKTAEDEILATHNDNEQDAVIERWINHFEQWLNASHYNNEWEKTKNNATNTYFIKKHEEMQHASTQSYYIENNTYGLVDSIVKIWFANKVDTMKIKIPLLRLTYKDDTKKQEPHDIKPQATSSIFVSNKEKKEKQDMLEKNEALFKRLGLTENMSKKIGQSLNCLIEQFCKAQSKILGSGDVTTVCIYENSDAMAFFNSHTKTITINFSSMSIVKYLVLLSKIISCNPAHDDIHAILYDETYIQYFAPRNAKAPVMLHELEHARRNDPQNKDQSAPHAQAQDPQGKIVDFDACANAYATLAYKNNLALSWINNVRASVPYDVQKTVETIMTNATVRNILQTLEEKNKEYLAQKLGLA